MNSDGSPRPFRDRAASWRAATHPSVRVSRVATSSGSQVEAAGVVEVGGRLGLGEAQVRGADLDQLSTGAQPGQRQGRVGPGADDQVHLRRKVVEEEGDVLLDVGSLGQVVVVQDECEVVREHAELVEQGRQRGFHVAGVRVERGERRGRGPRERTVDRDAGRRSRTSSASRSRSSRDTQAVGRLPPPDESQVASRLVLPNPAGAETRVRRVSFPRCRSSSSRARTTAPSRGRGAWSLVSTSGLVIRRSWLMRVGVRVRCARGPDRHALSGTSEDAQHLGGGTR